jgi:hypothetical protein
MSIPLPAFATPGVPLWINARDKDLVVEADLWRWNAGREAEATSRSLATLHRWPDQSGTRLPPAANRLVENLESLVDCTRVATEKCQP